MSLYKYSSFLEEIKNIINKSNNIFNICTNDLVNISYLKGNIILKDNIILECDILYSEVYNTPEMYFKLIDSNKGIYITFNDYIKKYPPYNMNMIKNAEINKRNHPLNGIVYDYLYLCKFNIFISELKGVKNVLIFWLSVVLQIFNIDITTIIEDIGK